MDFEKLKYPIGRYQLEDNINKTSIDNWIKDIELLPQKLSDAVKGVFIKAHTPSGNFSSG